MSFDETSVNGRVGAVARDFAQRQTKLFVRFATIEGAILVPAVVAIFVLELIDPKIGIWVIMGIAAVGGIILMTLVMNLQKQRQNAIDAARGETPLNL